MKKNLRLFLFNFVSLWLASAILLGVSFSAGYQIIALSALVLSLVNLLIKPLINILLLPINLLTLGGFRWLSNVIALYLVTLFVPQFKIAGFLFPGFNYEGFVIPQMYLSLFWVFVLTSFIISLTTAFLLWLTN